MPVMSAYIENMDRFKEYQEMLEMRDKVFEYFGDGWNGDIYGIMPQRIYHFVKRYNELVDKLSDKFILKKDVDKIKIISRGSLKEESADFDQSQFTFQFWDEAYDRYDSNTYYKRFSFPIHCLLYEDKELDEFIIKSLMSQIAEINEERTKKQKIAKKAASRRAKKKKKDELKLFEELTKKYGNMEA